MTMEMWLPIKVRKFLYYEFKCPVQNFNGTVRNSTQNQKLCSAKQQLTGHAVGRRFICKLLYGWGMPAAATTKLQYLPGFLALEWMLGHWPPALTHISPSAFDPCRRTCVFTTSAMVLSRRRTLIAVFSRSSVAWRFNSAILTIRIPVLYGSIIRPNTNSLSGALFGPVQVRIRIECSVRS